MLRKWEKKMQLFRDKVMERIQLERIINFKIVKM
jgi:hypothetical protein